MKMTVGELHFDFACLLVMCLNNKRSKTHPTTFGNDIRVWVRRPLGPSVQLQDKWTRITAELQLSGFVSCTYRTSRVKRDDLCIVTRNYAVYGEIDPLYDSKYSGRFVLTRIKESNKRR